MIVAALQLVDFRNYAGADVAFAAGPNLIVGSNGQGKTNMVEALGYLASLSSHRVSDDRAMIRTGADAAIVRARLRNGERELLVEVQLNRAGANRAQLNRAAIAVREIPRSISSVLFAPEDLALVRGEPAGRRRFLDSLLVQLSPRLAGVTADYDRVLRQRNTLLKTSRAAQRGGDLSTLEVWDDRLVDLGSELISARSALVAQLSPFVAESYRSVAGEDHRADIALRLSIEGAQPDDDDEIGADNPTSVPPAPAPERAPVALEVAAAAFRAALARVRRAELDRGISLVGPHRDDVLLELNGLPARGYASHGESWSFALALKLAAARILRERSTIGDPVIVLDDVFAELDERRRGRLAAAVSGFEQVIITAAVRGDVPDELAGRVLHIRAGVVVEPGGALEP